MARGVPQYITGTLPRLINGGQATALRAEIETVLQTYQSNATTAWETYDTIDATAGSLDRIYRSVGDRNLVSGAGDARLFIQIDQDVSNRIVFFPLQDWSDLSSTGSRIAGNNTSQSWSTIDDFSECRYYAIVNEYEFAMLVIQDNTWHFVHLGSQLRTHVPTNYRGIAFTTAAASAGSSVTVNLDRDITASIQDNTSATGPQNVWIYNITPTGVALRTATVEIAEVETIAAGSITFTTLVNNFDSGAIVGFDPSPMFSLASNNSTFTANINPTIYFTNAVDGTYSTATAQSADYELIAAALPTQSFTPGAIGELYGSRALLVADQSAKGGYRGTSELVAFVQSGTMLSGDLWRPNGVSANQYVVFPFILLTGYTGFNLALGPGAT